MPFVADNAPRSGRFKPDAPRFVPDATSPYSRVASESPVERFAAGLDYGPQTAAPDTLAPRTGYQPTTAGKLALRVGTPLAVGLGTGGLGLVPALALTGGAGLLGELGAETLEVAGGERQNISLPQVGTAGILSAVPGLPLGSVASPLVRGGIRVGEGALLGASAPLIQGALEGEMPSMGDVQANALGGAAFGVPFGAIEMLAGARGVRVPRSANAPEFFPQMDLVPAPTPEPMGNFVPNGVPSTAQESALAFARQLPEEIKSAQESASAFMPYLGAMDQGQAPAELAAMSEAFRRSVPTETNSVFPSELRDISGARDLADADIAGAAMTGATVDEVRLRRLAERMAGKGPEDQLEILKQEVKLAGDTLTPAEQRGALNMEQELQRQIDGQNALQDAVEAEQKAAADQQKAIQEQQKAIEAAQQPPEIPKSEQILAEPTSKPPSIANVATEVATQTKDSPYALQERLNQMTAVPTAQAASATPPPVASLNATDFRNWAAQQEGGITTSAYNAGLEAIGNAAKIKELKASRAAALAESEAANARIKQGDESAFDDASSLATKVQYFREAIEAAEGKGSAMGDPRVKAAHESKTTTTNVPPPQSAPANQAAARQAPKETVAPSAEQRLNNADLNLPPISSMSRDAKRAELEAGGITEYNGQPISEINPAQLSNALGKFRRRQLGAINPQLMAQLGGSAAGAAIGASEGETPEERIRNAIIGGSVGLGIGGGAALAANKLSRPKVRTYTSPVLQDVAQMLTPKVEKSSFLKLANDGYNNFRYRFNTRYAPIGQAQRALFKQAGKQFTPDSYQDLERSFERVAGAPVQAEGEVELLQGILDKLPSKNVEDFDTFLTLSRIEDRLLKTGEENAVLQDAVGRGQAEVAAAEAAVKANPGQRAFATLAARRDELSKAVNKLNENFDRKRVGDWSIAKARQGLTDLQQHVGPQAFAQLQQAGSEFQDVMKRTLQIQVDAGRLDPQLRDAILASNDFYAPFKVLKYFEDNEGFVKGGGTSRIPSQEQLAKKITGIDDDDVRIGSPTSTAAEQVYKGYILAEKNKKMRQLATLSRIDPAGDYVKPLAEGMEPRKGYEAVSYLQNGKPKRMEVARPIADALNGMDANESDIILRSLGKFSTVFKMGATGMSIPFNIANAAVFDPVRLATISKYGFRGPQDLLYTLYEWPKALLSSARGNLGQAAGMAPDALYEKWIKSGAANSTLARVMNPEAFTSRLPKNTKVGELVTDTNFGLRTPLKVASLLSNTLEETTKLLGLQRAMRLENIDSLPMAERQRKWDEIVTELRNYAGSPDFARSGVDMKALNIIMPFTNPRWQGFLSDFARVNPFRQGNAKDAAAAWARLGSLIAVPSAGLAWYNLSTPELEKDFNQIPQQERERYFHIPMFKDKEGKPSIIDYGHGGYYFKNKDGVDIRGYRRIPKREFPGLMANTIEDFVSYAKANDPQAFSQIAANFADNFGNTASPISIQGDNIEERMMSAAAGVNPAIRVPVEIGTNRNFFTGRDIVPEGRQKASPELQYSESTPEAYRSVAEALPDELPETLRSPAKLQHITEGMTGGFVRQFAAPRLSPGNPAGESSPLLGRFYRSERVENSDLMRGAEEAERGRTDQRITEQEIAGKLADLIQARTTPEAKRKVLTDAKAAGLLTPETFKYLKEDIVDAQRGLTYEDRVVKRSYSIAGGYRARYFLDRLAALPAEQRAVYLQDQKNKGLLTKEVAGQMAAVNQAK